jgi:hypothetical protein
LLKKGENLVGKRVVLVCMILLSLVVLPVSAKEKTINNDYNESLTNRINLQNEIKLNVNGSFNIHDYQKKYIDNDSLTKLNKKIMVNDEAYESNAIHWVLLGKAVFKIVAGTISVCSGVNYVAGHDLCRIVLDNLLNPPTYYVTYQVRGRYISGYIPGCEPRHSGVCNSGYWIYRFN